MHFEIIKKNQKDKQILNEGVNELMWLPIMCNLLSC